MKKTMLCMMLGATVLATSCLSEDQDFAPVQEQGSEKGQLVLTLSADANFSQQTRALNEADYLNTDNYTVELWNVDKDKLVYTCQANDFEAKVLDTDVTYEVRAYYGTEYAKSRNDFRMEGSKTFRFTEDGASPQSVNVECSPTCGKITANFDESMGNYFNSYKVNFGGTAQLGTDVCEWKQTDTEPWYVAIAKGSAGETITYTISLTAKPDYVDGSENGVVTGSFTLKRNTAHTLNIKPTYTPNVQGSLSVIVTIDDTTNDKPVDIVVPVTWI